MASGPYPYTLHGRTYTESDFGAYAYATGLPGALRGFQDGRAGSGGAAGNPQQLQATFAAGPVQGINKRGRSVVGAVARRPQDASIVLVTRGQFYEPGITIEGGYGRASVGTFHSGDGIIRSAASGVPRYGADPTTGNHIGLIMEGGRTNTVFPSEQFDDAGWGKVNATVTANAIEAPDGTITAEKLTYNTTGSIGFISRSLTMAGTSRYQYSVYAKAAEHSSFLFLINNAAFGGTLSNRTVTFDLIAKTATAAGLDLAGEVVGSIQALPNGWFRCMAEIKPDAALASTNIATHFIRGAVNGDATTLPGMYFWGAQFEAGNHVSSYIPTTTAQVTRPADTLVQNFGEWFNPAEGTFFYEFVSFGAAAENQVMGGLSNTAAPSFNDVVYLTYTTTGTIASTSRVGGVQSPSASVAISGKSVVRRVAHVYGLGGHGLCVDGGAVVTATGAIPTNMDRWVIGSAPWGLASNSLQGGMIEARYFPMRLSNEALQRMTG